MRLACASWIAGAVASHPFRVLRGSGVIRQIYRGRAPMNALRSDDLDDLFPGLLGSVLGAAARQAARLSSG
ncbi:hypothetical protein [Streptomyces sp. NPDC050564]|uniref:hypothetical protein n=1 Tax=Streptomyces sp. NPDC050564 TaxID=3365631 RepID=UPI00379347C0